MTESIYIPRGVNTDALNRSVSWDYKPEGFKVIFLLLMLWLLMIMATAMTLRVHIPVKFHQIRQIFTV